MAKKTSTRNLAFNYYYDNESKVYNYATSATATNTIADIKLIDGNDYILKTGNEIITDANENFNKPDPNKGYEGTINTNNINGNANYRIYGSPHKMVLDNKQQFNNCGIVSTLNSLAMAGLKTISNQNKLEKTFTKQMWDLGLASDDGTIGKFDRNDGGTQPGDYKEIFEYYGLNSDSYASEEMGGGSKGQAISIDEMSEIIKNGGVAVIAVSSDYLWGSVNLDPDKTVVDHAITVTGVVCNEDDTVIGFYIHDTAMWMTRYISYEDLKLFTLHEIDDRSWKTEKGIFGTVVTDNVKIMTNNLNITGSNTDNTLIGNSGNNIVKGLNGDDKIYGMTGTDKLYGGNGNDCIDGGENDDLIKGDGGNDIIVGGEGNDTIYGGKGSDWIYANEGTLSAELTEDYLDNLTSLIGRNIIHGDAGDDHIFGGNNNDLIYGGTGNDFLYGRDGIDVIYGGKGNDYITGGKGDDRLFGDAGNDIINGGEGDDVIFCGSGKDTVTFNYDKNLLYSCGMDRIKSSSGSVTFDIKSGSATQKTALQLVYKYDDAVFVSFDDNNGFEYQGFFNSKKNTYQTAYLKDSNDDLYKFCATKSSGKIKVANSKGNNILFATSAKNKTVTTSSYNDIVWMDNGNNTITYTGGKDKYFSGEGDDTYIVSNFGTDSYLSVNDSLNLNEDDDLNNNIENLITSPNDTMNISTDKQNLRLFFNMTKEGYTSDKFNNLYLINTNDTIDKEYALSIFDENTTGVISIQDYFAIDADILDSEKYIGQGCIENIYANTEKLDIISTISSIQNNVISWLQDGAHYYDSVYSALSDENADELLAYFNVNINIES